MAAASANLEQDLARHPLVQAVAEGLRGPAGVPEGAAVLVACSGGCDSVALLCALHRLATRRGFGHRLVVGHIQHHLRRDAAEADAGFVQALSGRLGLSFARADLEPPPTDAGGNVEAWAREARYAALARLAAEADAGFVATAHHADDQLETLVMRLMRGTGIAGLRGIAARRPADRPEVTIIRPMLGATRADAEDLLRQLGQPYRHDATNDDTARLRNALRHEVLPALLALAPDLRQRAQDLAEHADDLAALVHAVQADPTGESRRDLAMMPAAALKAWLRAELIEAGCPADRLTHRRLNTISQAIRDERGGVRLFELAEGVSVRVEADAVRVIRRPGPV